SAPASSSAPAAPSGSASAAAPAEKHAPVDITIGTGGTAGTYYVVAAAMAQAINDNSDFLNVTVQATKGSVENINLANTGELEMGMSNSDGVYWATTGTGSYAGKEQDVSAVMSLYLSCGQMATLKDSGINSYADLKGKKVCLGPPSTTIVEMSKAILRAYGIDPEKDIKPYYLAFDEGLSELTDGTIDATFFVAAAPTSAMVNACSTGNIRLVDVPEDVLAAIAKENPYYSLYKIPAGTYNGNDKDINTLKILTEIFVNNDVPEDVVYEFVKQSLENVESYVGAHVACQEINPETAASTISRMHPGALKYYTEVGVK
ncbi:MAG: TAXI family TRAP transporter solute-binding subunit, partial [Angelakisella sp.]